MDFRLFKTKIGFTPLFFALIGFLCCLEDSEMCMFSLLYSLVHEAAHIIVASFSAFPCRIMFCAGHIELDYPEMPDITTACVAAVGPVANIILAVVFAINGTETHALLNASIAVFNLLPATSLDGGRILEIILRRTVSVAVSEKILHILTTVVYVLFLSGMFSLFVFSRGASAASAAIFFTLTLLDGKWIRDFFMKY